jgi:hypothetical protein
MEWRSSGEFEITDLGDRLEVVYRAEQGLLGWVFAAVTGVGAIYAFWNTSELLGILVVAVFLFSLFNSIRKGNETRMLVRPDGFIVEGNIDRAFRGRITVSVDDIYDVEYFIGYEGSPNGLYARGTWCATCLIPGIDKESCQQIQSAIEEKFPDMHFGQSQLSGIFGTGPDIVTLGLNKPRNGKPKLPTG